MINREDLSHFGASIQPANVPAGTPCWRLIEARVANPNTEFGGDHHVFIEAVDENGQQLRQVQAQIEVGNEIHRPTLDKGLNEPGTNWPLWRGTRVFVSMGAASDRVGPIHTETGVYKGGDLFHHAWLLKFQRTVAGGGQPISPIDTHPVIDEEPEVTPPPPPNDSGELDAATLRTIREESWRQVRVAFNRDSAFARYARQRNLGAPLTNEYDIGNFRAQGFTGGIVYARIGDWNNITHVAW
jgi:hypothetical protein